jgi:hypothetical protein
MSTYATRRLCAKGCENTERRAEENAKKLLRRQNVEKEKYKSWIRSYDTEARQRDDMTRHWDLHRQMIVTTQDKYTQFNTMWAARDDIYRKRREEAFQRRIQRYQDANDLVTQRTDEFCARRDRILDPNANGSTYQIAGDSATQQKEMLERKKIMSSLSRLNEIELYRNRDQNVTMAIEPVRRMKSVPLMPELDGATFASEFVPRSSGVTFAS